MPDSCRERIACDLNGGPNQGRIKGGGVTGAIAPSPGLQGGPPWWHLFVLNKIFVWKIVVIYKKYNNTTLYSDVALSIIIMIFLQVWLSASFSNHYWI